MTEVLIDRAGPVARLTLNRPDAGNAFNQPMADALLEAALAVANDPEVRVVTLTGAGRMFCVGGDVGDFARNGDAIGAFLAKLAGTLHQALAQFAAMKKPLVTLVNGPAAGAGMSLAISGDFVLAAPEANFTAAYGGIGLTPDGGMSWMLPRLVGLRQAQDIILSNRCVSAEDAVAIGLATRIAPPDGLIAEGDTLAASLADRAVGAMGRARWLMQTGMTEGFVAQMDRELQSIVAAGEGPEGREGVQAFLDRRKPDFQKG
ncbi:MAG: enoyl-CoA hydratase [Rhodobacteraceae bacterium]|nr:enoyl-CoA hydratase [Paracoccaceae bacterium]